MKLVYVLGIFLLFGLAFCEEAAEAEDEPSDDVAEETEPEVEDEEASDEDDEDEEDEDEENDEDEEDEEDEQSDVEDASHRKSGYGHGHGHGKKCRVVRKRVCNRQRVCRPKYFYRKASRKVKYCFNKLLKKTRKECRKFCWNRPKSYYPYRKGGRVCKRRCYRVPLVKKICKFRRIFYPEWTFKNVCKTIKECFKIPVGKRCRRRRHHGKKY